jgi:two-component sensor histidine kinase
MALHELATNAAKYGALSNATGRIEITWSVEPGASLEQKFTLVWLESGGPSVARPKRPGFGSKVITGMVETSTGGKVSLEYAPAGLAWRLLSPVAGVVAA